MKLSLHPPPSLFLLPWLFSYLTDHPFVVLVRAARTGDEIYAEQTGGRFWAFHSGGLSIVNPDTCQVERTISDDAAGNPLPESWSSGVYMEVSGVTPGTTKGDAKEGFVVINSGATSYNDGDDGLDSAELATGHVVIFSTNGVLTTSQRHSAAVVDKEESENNPVLGRVTVGGEALDAYAIQGFGKSEFWTLSDADGMYYAFDLNPWLSETRQSAQHLKATKVTTAAGAPDGQLVWRQSTDGSVVGYTTSTKSQDLYLVDMQRKKQINTVNYGQFIQQGLCQGTRSIAFSTVNEHIYLECFKTGGILELDASDPLGLKFVQHHVNVTGKLLESPDDALIVANDQKNSLVTILQPSGRGNPSDVGRAMFVEGHPMAPVFYPQGYQPAHTNADSNSSVVTNRQAVVSSESANVFTKYTICMPLVENVNRNNMDPTTGQPVCDAFTSCGNAKTPSDVNAGLCLYHPTGKTLMAAHLEDLDNVKNEAAPFYGACKRCKHEKNYVNYNKVCVCTPHCGSCAKVEYDSRESGVVCMELDDKSIVNDKSETDPGTVTTRIANAGAVRQALPTDADTPQCGYGETQRSHKRGGIFHASVADFPTNSLQIVNMQDRTLKCAVDLPGRPDQVLYVPPSGMKRLYEDHDGVSGTGKGFRYPSPGGLGGIFLLACVVVVLSLMLLTNFNSRRAAEKNIEANATTWQEEQKREESLPDVV